MTQPDPSGMVVFSLMLVSNFYIFLCRVASFEPFVRWSVVYGETRYVHTDLTSWQLRGVSNASCRGLCVAVEVL